MAQLKKPTTHQEQLNILEARNLVIDSQDCCTEILKSINYYRFTAYLLPFKQKDDSYRVGTTFHRAYRIYEFDRKLRNILFAALEEVEVYLRAKFSYFHAHKYGEEGYINPANYSTNMRVDKFEANIKRVIDENKRSAVVVHHQKHYGGHFPVWVIMELFTFGMLSRFYSDLTTADQKILAREIYQTVPKNISSWLRCCTDLRNICAHYGRLYYRIFPATPANFSIKTPQINQLWGAVLALHALYPHAAKWNDEILSALRMLFDEYAADIFLSHIGFPEEWEQQLQKPHN